MIDPVDKITKVALDGHATNRHGSEMSDLRPKIRTKFHQQHNCFWTALNEPLTCLQVSWLGKYQTVGALLALVVVPPRK